MERTPITDNQLLHRCPLGLVCIPVEVLIEQLFPTPNCKATLRIVGAQSQ